VKELDLRHLDVLVAAGIDGPKRLFSYTPETLTKHLSDVSTEKKLAGPLPTSEDIAAWFANPKPGDERGHGREARTRTEAGKRRRPLVRRGGGAPPMTSRPKKAPPTFTSAAIARSWPNLFRDFALDGLLQRWSTASQCLEDWSR